MSQNQTVETLAAGTGADGRQPGKPLLVKIGKKSRAQIDELKDRGGPLMDRIEKILRKLESEGRVDDDAQIVIAMVR